MNLALPLLASFVAAAAPTTVDGVPVVEAGPGGADAASAVKVACAGACAVFGTASAGSFAGLNGTYLVTGFAANAVVHVHMDSSKGDGKGCSTTVSIGLGSGGSEIYGGLNGQACPTVDVNADASGNVAVDHQGDTPADQGLVFNPKGTGASSGDTACDETQANQCAGTLTCENGKCVKSSTGCSSTSTGGRSPWGTLAAAAIAGVIFARARRSCRSGSGSR